MMAANEKVSSAQRIQELRSEIAQAESVGVPARRLIVARRALARAEKAEAGKVGAVDPAIILAIIALVQKIVEAWLARNK
jgi:hypothetical protein